MTDKEKVVTASEQEIEARQAGIIKAVTSRLTNTKLKGSELWASCPMGTHQDKNPSFSINLTEGIFYCFTCQSSGTVDQLAIRMGIREEGKDKPTFKRKSKPMKLLPWQLAKRIGESFDTLEDCWYTKEKRKKRNKLEMDWNEAIIDEAEYYFQRQLLNYDFDCKMEIHDHNRNRLTYEAKHGTDNDNE